MSEVRAEFKAWAAGPFRRFIRYHRESHRILELSIKGLVQVARMTPLAEALAKLERPEETPDLVTEEEERRLRDVKEDADFAEGEEAQGFPRLYAHATVDLWGALEVLVEDLIVAWLVNVPTALSWPAVAKVRLRISDFDAASREERMRAVYGELERGTGSRGADRMEGVLAAIGFPMSGISGDVLRDINELEQVRNTILHSGSVVDQRLLRACPWLGVGLGERLRVTAQDYERYVASSYKYLMTLIDRARGHFGIPPYVPGSEESPIPVSNKESSE